MASILEKAIRTKEVPMDMDDDESEPVTETEHIEETFMLVDNNENENSVELDSDSSKRSNRQESSELVKAVGNKKPFSQSSLTEQKWWSVMKNIPVVGTVYGGFRGPVYALKGHKEEAYRSLAGSLGNLAGTGAAVAGACMSGPMIVPVLAAIVGGGVVQQTVGGGGEVIVDSCSGEFQSKTPTEKEAYLYDKIFRDAPVVGGVYSLIRGAVYKRKNNRDEAHESYKNAAINGISSGVAIGAGYAASKMALSATANGATKMAALAKRSRIVVKDTVKTAPALGLIAVHELEHLCEDLIPKAQDVIAQVLMIVENTINCLDCPIGRRLGFLVFKILEDEFRVYFGSSAFLTLAVLRAGLPFLQAILCLKPGIQDHFAVAREFVEIAEEELRAENLPLTRRISLEIRLQVVQYFLQALDPNGSAIQCRLGLGPPQSEFWNDRPDLSKYRVRTEPPVLYRPPVKTSKTGMRILNLDGGGTKGLLLLEFLEEIERRTNMSIAANFDYICGTSTGGIIAIGLGLGRTVANIRQLYFSLKNKIFEGGRKPYKHEVLEEELKLSFGKFTTMRDITRVKVIVTASVITGKTFDTKLFTNFEPETWSIPLWEVGRCTTAAPSYFEPHRIASLNQVFYDGGLGSNNPTIVSIHKISDREPVMEGSIIVSLGTGKLVDENPNQPPLVVGSSLKFILNGELKRLIDILVEQIAKSDGEPVQQAVKLCTWMKAFYYRLTPIIPADITLDEINDEILINLIFHTKAYISANTAVIDEVCESLKARSDQTDEDLAAALAANSIGGPGLSTSSTHQIMDT